VCDILSCRNRRGTINERTQGRSQRESRWKNAAVFWGGLPYWTKPHHERGWLKCVCSKFLVNPKIKHVGSQWETIYHRSGPIESKLYQQNEDVRETPRTNYNQRYDPSECPVLNHLAMKFWGGWSLIIVKGDLSQSLETIAMENWLLKQLPWL
jgi:hypothetical protein